jgi:hypothetical protein
MGCGASKKSCEDAPIRAPPKDCEPSYKEPPADLQPQGELKSCKVSELTGDGPMLIGKAPMPKNLRGLFWLHAQGDSSCLASMGGPSNDGGEFSTGQMSKDYWIRVSGDRSWAFADKDSPTLKSAAKFDVAYDFQWDSVEDPTFAQIYIKFLKLGFTIESEWLMDYEMYLVPEGLEEYPGSVVWRRRSKFINGLLNWAAGWDDTHKTKPGESGGANYYLVQVIDENGERIQPAFDKFAEAMNRPEHGAEPGTFWYREIN